jgi:hypothetical protein
MFQKNINNDLERERATVFVGYCWLCTTPTVRLMHSTYLYLFAKKKFTTTSNILKGERVCTSVWLVTCVDAGDERVQQG